MASLEEEKKAAAMRFKSSKHQRMKTMIDHGIGGIVTKYILYDLDASGEQLTISFIAAVINGPFKSACRGRVCKK